MRVGSESEGQWLLRKGSQNVFNESESVWQYVHQGSKAFHQSQMGLDRKKGSL